MTCIIAIKDKINNSVIIGGDTFGSNGYSGGTLSTLKVFKNGCIIMGCTSSYRMIQLLQYKLQVPKNLYDKDLITYLCTEFIDGVIKLFTESKYGIEIGGQKKGGQFIVAHKDRKFIVQEDFSVLESDCDYDSVGCGSEFALGSLHSTQGNPKNRIIKALDAASKFSTGVAPPYTFLSTGD